MYDAIVIGAGFGGVTCAALLAKQGKQVLLVDKNPQPGGKGVTLRRDGFAYEMWPIMGGPSESSRYHQLVEAIGGSTDDDLILLERAGEFRYVRPDGSVAAVDFSARPSDDPAAMVRLPNELGATDNETLGLMGLAAAVFSTSPDEYENLDTIDALSWCRKFGLGDALESYMFTVLNLLFVVPLDRLPASEAIKTLKDFFSAGAGRFHRGGYGKPAEDSVEFLLANGGEYRPGTRVEQVLVEDGRAVGIRTNDGEELRARTVISNAGIQPTILKMVASDALPADYVDWVTLLEPSLAFVGIRYWLDAPVLTQPMVLQFSNESWWDTERYLAAESGDWAEHPLLFITVPSLFDPSLAPEGQQLILAGTMSTPDPKSPMNEAAIEIVDRETRWSFPEIEGHILRQQSYTALHVSNATRDSAVPGQGGECIGLGQMIGQCGATKPDIRTPLRGLYLVGCDAGGYGCGTHQAVDSGFNVAEAVAADLAGGAGAS